MLPRRSPDAISRDLGDGESVVLAGEDQAIVLNAVATAVWHLCDGTRDNEAVVTVIAERFPDVALEQIRVDVEGLVRRLLDAGLFELP